MENKEYISDELLAAYFDGNTNEAETQCVLNALQSDPALREAVDISLRIADETPVYDVLPMMQMAAESGNNICSLLCEAYVMHRRHISFDENELLSVAQRNHWLTSKGTPLYAVGQLLAHYGLMVTRQYDAAIEEISEALSLDNDVLVAVDSDKLYNRADDPEDAPNHVVAVKAIHPDGVKLFDPSCQAADTTVPLPDFLRAWQESRNYMVRVLLTIQDYTPHPISLDAIQLTDDLMELREAIAENAHEVWAAARIKEGWTYGKERNDSERKHPDLVPYSALPDSEKEYDRLMALDTIRLVKKLGFEIVKR